jgi:hypothetical protein
MMDMILNDGQIPEPRVGNADGDTFVVFSGLEDFNGEFCFEDFERVTGKSYYNYLRFYDDMI